MIKDMKIRDMRDFIRFMTVILLVPWFGWFSENTFGVEIEFEVEMITFLSFIVFGSFWCGWLCPFGNLSYFVGKAGKKLFPSIQLTFEGRIDRGLRLLKYVFLGGFLYLIIGGGYDYFFGSHMAIYKASPPSLIFLQVKKYLIILVPLLIPRFFCKYICPQKALYNIIHRFIPSLVIERDATSCVGCKRCDRECPMGIAVSREVRIYGRDCISCFNCVDGETCPEKADALKLKFVGREVDVRGFSLMALGVYILGTYLAMKYIK